MTLDIYVDGSYYRDDPGKTYGAYVILDNEKPIIAQRITSTEEDFTNMWNVGGELLAAIFSMKALNALITAAEVKESVQVNLYYDYMGIYEWVKPVKPWSAKKPGAQLYVATMQKLREQMPNISINYKKVKAHTGNKWNEVIDLIAKGEKPEECVSAMLEPVVR